MGWLNNLLWSSSSDASSKKPSADDDPLKNLDPALRAFLDKESPVKYQRAAAENSLASAREASAAAASAAAEAAASQPAPLVPPQSMYQDGRYAHLWKTYKPLSAVEDEGKSNNEKMADVLQGFRARKDSIGKAALENCALQQEEWMQCLKSGAWEDRLMLCRKQIRRFEHCYNMQHRFLRTLGYQANASLSPDVNDAIQIHADNLYQRLVAHEAAVADAKAAGLPEPVWEPSHTTPLGISSPSAAAANKNSNNNNNNTIPAPAPSEVAQWQQKLADMPEEERPFEQAALRADFGVKAHTAEQVQRLMAEESRDVEARRKSGRASLLDYVWAMFKPAGDGK
ncbi:hypothetical protein TD95_001170 [Thielaviopsis punctulata]|uniref:Autophagy-related protein 6 n=1 Tax=Thielaviopsis punctulata TaxID=72032 RepID=A0A0F4ZJB0_9PEZI|nr:hypothetical protein TD95_001170 [Thielaviopsis punctulata]